MVETVRTLALLLTATLLSTAASACIDINQGPSSSARPVRMSGTPVTTTAAAKGTMTGAQSGEQTTSALCMNGVSLSPDQAYCAAHTIWINGDIDQLADLPVALSTFAGAIDVKGVDGNAWNLTALLRAQGNSDSSARSNLGNIEFTWSHIKGDGHYLQAAAKKKDQQTNNHESASLTLTIPAALELFLTGNSGSGSIDVAQLKVSQAVLNSGSGSIGASQLHGSWLVATTGSGGVSANDLSMQDVQINSGSGSIDVRGEVEALSASAGSGTISVDVRAANVDVGTGSGGVTAKVTPTGIGDVKLHTGSGSASLTVPEDQQHGYSVTVTTGSGTATIGLRDGSQGGKDSKKTFLTTGFSQRGIRTNVDVETSSGSASVNAG